ncbi:MAG TPA: DUF4870 domain-containing protein [Candidatus Acidoferrales bacterium]
MMEQETLAPTSDDKTLAFLAQFLQVFTWFIGPLVIYVVKRESRFVAFHAMQALLWQVVYFVLSMICMALFFVTFFMSAASRGGPQSPSQGPPVAFLIFFPLIWLMMMGGWVLTLVIGIVFGIRAMRGEWAAYPIIGRWARRIIGA